MSLFQMFGVTADPDDPAQVDALLRLKQMCDEMEEKMLWDVLSQPAGPTTGWE